MKKTLRDWAIHHPIARFVALIALLAVLPMNARQAYAENTTAKVLVWSTYILQTEIKKLYVSGLKDFVSADEVAGYAEFDSITVDIKAGTTQENPQHFIGNEDLSQYSLIVVLLPYEALTDADVSVFRNYLNAGGRIVLQGERSGFARTENAVLSNFAEQLGVTVQISMNDDDQDNAMLDVNTDIMGGTDLVGNELEYRAAGEIVYSGDAQVVARTADKKYPFIVDFPVQKGHITVMSDINWWHRRSNMALTPAQLQSAQELWGRIIRRTAKDMEDVKNRHEHHYNYVSHGNQILAYCDETHAAIHCDHNGISNAIAVTLIADDAVYSGKAYSGFTVEGIEAYNAMTNSQLDRSQVCFYRVETKGATSGGTQLESAPKEAGHYYAAINSNGAQAVDAFSIVELPKALPKTGDNSHLAMWLTLLLISGAGVIGAAAYGRKKRSAR